MDKFPNQVILINKEVCNLLRMSYITCYRKRKSGEFTPDSVEVEKLINRGVKIKTLDKRLDTTTMDKSILKLIVGIMEYCSEQELSQIKSRCFERRQVSISRGVKFGRKRS